MSWVQIAEVLSKLEILRSLKKIEKFRRQDPLKKWDEVQSETIPIEDQDKQYTCLSPRNIEAAMLGVVQILTPGPYGNLLESGQDYILLEEDGSNIDDVMEILKNKNQCREIANNCREKILSYSDLYAKNMIDKCLSYCEQKKESVLEFNKFNKFLLAVYLVDNRLRYFIKYIYVRSRLFISSKYKKS